MYMYSLVISVKHKTTLQTPVIVDLMCQGEKKANVTRLSIVNDINCLHVWLAAPKYDIDSTIQIGT